MSYERVRHGMLRVFVAIFGMTILGGCTQAAPAALETFVAELMRNAAAAILL